MSVYITGDTHGGFQRFGSKYFPQQKNMGREDYVIVTGDFGGLWDGSPKDQYWLDWLEEKPFTTLFVDGNHENFDLLNALPERPWNGGRVQVAPSAAPVGEPSENDGSFSVPAEQPTRHFTDAEVRRNYEYILTSTNLYPPELHSAVRSVLSEPPLNLDWSDKGRQIAALFTPYGDREYQGDLLYRTRLHGEDGIPFFFDEGYTYIPWNGLAFLLDAMIEDGD